MIRENLVLLSILVFTVATIVSAEEPPYDCMLVRKGTTVISNNITIRGTNFASQITCNVSSKRKAKFLGGLWCINDNIYFKGIGKRSHEIYTCHVRNFIYPIKYAHPKK